MTENHIWPRNAYDDETDSGRRLKPRGKRRKRFVIQFRFSYSPKNMFFPILAGWHTYSRYATEAARDQALAVLVNKEQNSAYWWTKRDFRKLDR